MSSLTPFLFVATMVAAVGAASIGYAQPQPTAQDASTAAFAQLRQAAGRASSVEPGVLVLAAR